MDTTRILQFNIPLMQCGNSEGSLALCLWYTVILKITERATSQFEQPRCVQDEIRDRKRGHDKKDALQPTGVSAN
jgi:hypothetical protein